MSKRLYAKHIHETRIDPVNESPASRQILRHGWFDSPDRLHYLPVGEYTAMAMTTPLLVTMLASRFLGEHVSIFRLTLVGGGLAGTLVIVRPGSNAIGWAMLFPLALVLVNPS